MDYIGLQCGICGEDFKDGDDVVVCPDCGTPMHRACYKELGDCPNADKHKDGFVFEGFGKITDAAKGKTAENEKVVLTKIKNPAAAKTVQDAQSEGTCPICGNKNRSGANFCDKCGARLTDNLLPASGQASPEDYSDPEFFASYALGRDSDVPASAEYGDDVTAGDLACYVAVNTPYYLGAFRRIKDGSGKFNFSAAVFSGVWFLYRKLYKLGMLLLSIEALLYALKVYFTHNVSLDVMNKLLASIGLSVSSVTSLTMEQYMQLSQEMQKLPAGEQFAMMMPTIILILQIGVMVFSGAVANKLYYRKCISTIKELKTEASDRALSRSETSQELYLSGGVNALLGIIFGAMYLFFLFM